MIVKASLMLYLNNIAIFIASTSYLQTTLGMGFARSARVMSQLEAAGIVGPQDPRSKNREVLVQTLAELDEIIKRFRNQ